MSSVVAKDQISMRGAIKCCCLVLSSYSISSNFDGVYYLIPKEQTGKRNIVLLVASLFFG